MIRNLIGFFSKPVEQPVEKPLVPIAITRLLAYRGHYVSCDYQIGGKTCATVHELFKELSEQYGFSADGKERVFSFLGKGNVAAGETKFNRLVDQRRIQLEKVGVDKHGRPKFYLMVSKKRFVGGAFNYYHKAFSRRLTPRAVTRVQDPFSLKNQGLQAGRKNAQAFFKEMKREGKKEIEGVSKIMNEEEGVRVSELGSCDFSKLLRRKDGHLSAMERRKMYQHLFKGLAAIHGKGFVHRDIKPENIVALCDLNGEVTGAKIIDFDFLIEEKMVKKKGDGAGSLPFFPPEKIAMFLRGSQAGSKEAAKVDVWAAMCTLCTVEMQISEGQEGLLSPEFLKRFKEYASTGNPYGPLPEWVREKISFMSKYPENLFQGLEPKTPMDRVVFAAAYTDPSKREGSQQIAGLFEERSAKPESLSPNKPSASPSIFKSICTFLNKMLCGITAFFSKK